MSHFRFKELGPASVYTGVYIFRDRPSRCLYLDQAPYVAEILYDFGMSNSTPPAIPMDPRQSWMPSDPITDTILDNTGKRLYQRAIGQLMYLMLATRPDIAYAVTKPAQFSACPSERHWLGVLRVMRYLRKYPSVQLCLGNKPPPYLLYYLLSQWSLVILTHLSWIVLHRARVLVLIFSFYMVHVYLVPLRSKL